MATHAGPALGQHVQHANREPQPPRRGRLRQLPGLRHLGARPPVLAPRHRHTTGAVASAATGNGLSRGRRAVVTSTKRLSGHRPWTPRLRGEPLVPGGTGTVHRAYTALHNIHRRLCSPRRHDPSRLRGPHLCHAPPVRHRPPCPAAGLRRPSAVRTGWWRAGPHGGCGAAGASHRVGPRPSARPWRRRPWRPGLADFGPRRDGCGHRCGLSRRIAPLTTRTRPASRRRGATLATAPGCAA